MRRILLRSLLLVLFSLTLFAQNSNFTILCVAAHPDDEDGATLAYYSKLYGYRAFTVFYTRGEGGQNEIGPELNDELGRIREKECNDAAEVQGSHAYFLGELDFGFSKTAKETFKMWGGKEGVIGRIVYMIRKLRPDVVITNHDTITVKPNRQHGNHQAVGISIYEAFEKAADRNYMPEQFNNGVEPWQVKKLFFRVFDTTRTANIFEIDISQKDKSGISIEDISFEALGKHRTQGMDKISRSDIPVVFSKRRYELIKADKMYPLEGNDLFGGLVPEANKPEPKLSSFETTYNYKPRYKLDMSNINYDKSVSIGLVRTYDNTIENFLNEIGLKYELLDSAKLTGKELPKYDVLMLDLRTYLYRKDVLLYNDKILDYVQKGGNVICFYNKPSDWNNEKKLSPYPLKITNLRVTEEDAKVTVLIPEHPFFNTPNKMNEDDWSGWVQERNVYLPSDDSTSNIYNYRQLLAMNDEDDPVPSTSLLYTNYGFGSYTYCSLALYRQIKVQNPGAIKLFLNMLSQKRQSVYKPK